MNTFIESMLPWTPAIILGIVVIVFLIVGYIKAPPDTAFIISGIKRRVIIGGAAIKIPMLERLDKLSLKLIPVDVKTSAAVPTADYININVDAAVNIQISSEPDKLNLAAQNFLNQPTDYIRQIAREVLEGNMREIVGKMKLEEMVSDRQKFAELVKANAEPDFAAMGLNIICFNVQNFKDDNGIIDDLGIDNVSQIKKKAAIAKACADKEIAIAQSDADRQANDARIAAQLEIAKKNTDLAIKEADLKIATDTKRAEADAAYEIRQQSQRELIEVARTNADIAKQTREVELKRTEAEVSEQSYIATVHKESDAKLYRDQKAAEGNLFQEERKADASRYQRQLDADARKYEMTQEADAHKYGMTQEAEGIMAKAAAEAEEIRLKGQATADAILAQGVAEAEAMQRRADAYAKYGQAAVIEMLVQVLPQIATEVAKPLSQIDKITIIGGSGGDGSSIDSVSNNVPALMARTFEAVKDATGVDMTEIVRASTYDAAVNRNLSVTGLSGKPLAEAVVTAVESPTPEVES